MLDFYHAYVEVAVVNLTENYRSASDILQVAGTIAGQIEARLQDEFKGLEKQLVAKQ